MSHAEALQTLHPAVGATEAIVEFVNELRNIIPANGFSDPPSLSVTPSGIAASFWASCLSSARTSAT